MNDDDYNRVLLYTEIVINLNIFAPGTKYSRHSNKMKHISQNSAVYVQSFGGKKYNCLCRSSNKNVSASSAYISLYVEVCFWQLAIDLSLYLLNYNSKAVQIYDYPHSIFSSLLIYITIRRIFVGFLMAHFWRLHIALLMLFLSVSKW